MKFRTLNLLFAGMVLLTMVSAVQPALATKPSPVFFKAQDSLRVGGVMKDMKKLSVTIQDKIIPALSGDQKKALKDQLNALKDLLKGSEGMFKDTNQTDFKKLSAEEKNKLKDIDAAVLGIRHALPEKSEEYHTVMLSYVNLYRAIQEMQDDGRTPLLATYLMAYDPNTTTNNQVTMVGAYLNFYLEYRITVGGITMGPDIVDPERVVFTFPDKLLEGIKEPTFIEVKAAPHKQTGVGREKKFVEGEEQHAWLLVYPKK